MPNFQDVDLTVMDAHEWNETDQKIADIKKLIEEEWLKDDALLHEALDDAIKASLKTEVMGEKN